MRTQYENTAILLIIKGVGGRVSLNGVAARVLVNGPSDISYRVAKGASDRSLSDALVSLPAPARDIHRASSPCLQTPQRQIALRGEGIWASPRK